MRTVILLILFVTFFQSQAIGQKRAIDYRRTLAVLEDPRIDEASGLVVSNLHDGILWTHNDSGDSARLFAIDTLGVTRYVLHLEGVQARDWEDLAHGVVDGVSYLFVGDIGDNRRQRSEYQIHRVAEPIDLTGGEGSTSEVSTIRYTYDDGPQNSETLLYSAEPEILAIANKGSTRVKFYTLEPNSWSNEEHLATFSLELEFPDNGLGSDELQGLVGGDSRGEQGIFKTYSSVFVSRDTVEPVVDEYPYVMEPQGEAIALARDLSGYYTLSEVRNGIPATLYFYPMTDSSAVELIRLSLGIAKFNLDLRPKEQKSILSFLAQIDDSIQIYIAEKNGTPFEVLYDGEIKENEEFTLAFKTDQVKNGDYNLFIVGDKFTKQEEITVY